MAQLKITLREGQCLDYLHHRCDPRIVHCDIKSSNIHIDEWLEAHVSEFGLEKLLGDGKTHLTTIFVGTLGYLSPSMFSFLLHMSLSLFMFIICIKTLIFILQCQNRVLATWERNKQIKCEHLWSSINGIPLWNKAKQSFRYEWGSESSRMGESKSIFPFILK